MIVEHDIFKSRRTLQWLLAAFAGVRIVCAFYYPPRYSEFADFHYPFASLSDFGYYPFIHYWMEYPPLFPWMSVAVYKLCSLLAEPGTASHFEGYCGVLQSSVALLDVGNVVLVFQIVKRNWNAQRGLLAAGTFALSFALNQADAGFFDSATLFCILLSMEFYLRDQEFSAGVALGFGIVTKLMPVALLPAMACSKWNRISLSRLGLGTVIPVVLFWGSFFLVSPDLAVMPLKANSVRQPWETVWALAENQFLFGFLGPVPSADSVLDVHPKVWQAADALRGHGNGLNPAQLFRLVGRFTTDLKLYPTMKSRSSYFGCGVLVLAMVILSLRRVLGNYTPRRFVSYCGFLVFLFLLYSKGWSPQFVVIPTAFLLIGFPHWRGVAAATFLLGINYLEYPVWLFEMQTGSSTARDSMLTGVVIARTLLLAIGAYLFYVGATRRSEEPSTDE